MLTIVPAGAESLKNLNQLDARYLAGELVQVRVTRKGFSPEYTPLPTAEWRKWPPHKSVTAERLSSQKDWTCLFAYLDGKLAGQAVAKPMAFGLCQLVDIRVDAGVRRQGIGTQLLSACVDWTRNNGLKGMLAEMSDQNPVACQFLEGSGFVLGGVDKLRHYADPAQASRPAALRDSVLSFYRFFR